MSRRKQSKPRQYTDADEEGTVGDDASQQLQDTTAILPVEKQVQEKESIFTDDIDNDDDNSSDSDAFHIDLKDDTSPLQSYDSDSEERKFSGIQGPLSPIDNQSDGSEELDEETRLLLEKSDNIEAVHTVNGEKLYICPVCNLQLDNLRLLTMHIRNHNSKVPSSHSCTICGKVLCSQSSLDRHMLVHSGERPFKCQICNLAFTTNGNMHRHMRVHEKEFAKSPQALKEMLDAGLLTGYTPDGRRIRKRRRPAEGEVDGNAERRKRRSIDGASNGATMNDDESVVQVALKKKLGVYNGEESPSKEEDGNESEEVFQDGANQTQGENGENGEGEQLHCPICNRGFLCKNGLMSHLETHPEYKIQCQICNVSFRNLRGLNMHNHMVHIRKPEDKKNGVKTSVPVGFQDLGFVDFSIDKFPLIAKSWCEHNKRRSSSSYHNFECRKCEKAFPCGGALKLHKDSHTPETSTTCDVCECDFENNAALKEHQLSHTADRVLSESPEKDSDDDSNVSKEDFLAMLSLQGQGHESDENDSEMNDDSEEKFDSKLNQDYFYNIGQVNRPNKLSSILPKPLRRTADKEENNNSNDFADIQKIIQTANVSGLNSLVPVTPTDIHPAFRLEAMPKLQHISKMAASQGLVSKPATTSPPPLQLMAAGMYKHEQMDPDLMCVPLDDAYSSDQDGSTDDQTKNFTCKYCDTGFETFNAMKVHMRTHLGLSPYKCNMCSYASADKTTLIRHLRTHNGERPFQCKICDFAFTTKANCERHARKKHKLETKDEIDTAVGYNQFIGGDSPVKQEGDFASPDTICKYCGIDFKFFRALKHHLHSHSSCPQKPYVCLVCSIGFSTRANCIRHIQKRHPNIEPNQIEKNICTNIPVAHSGMPSTQPFESPFSKLNLPSLPNMMQLPLGTTPPPAHNKAIEPHRLFMGTAESKMPFEGVSIKRESPAQYDSPLDFSKKIMKEESPDSAINLSTSPAPEMDLSRSSDEPMDLSLSVKSEGRKTSTIPRSSYEPPMLKPGEVAPGVGMVSPMMPSGLLDPMSLPHMPSNPFSFRTFKCPYCAVQFSQEAKLVLHMRTHTTNRPFQCTFCPAGFTIKTNLDIHIRTRHLNDSGSLRSKFVPPTLKMMAKRRQATGSAMHSYLKPRFGQFRKPSLEKKEADAPSASPQVNSSGSGSDSNCELASVSKILNTTSSDQFQVFFNNPDPNSAERTIPIPIKITKVDRSEDASSISPNSAEKNADSSGNDSPDKMKKKRNSYANAPNRVACPYCTRTFPWISSLRRHILTHTGQKPYKCPECSVHFSTKSNRERHLLRKHGLNPNNPHTRQIMDRPYKCQLCVFSSFSKPEKLIMHYKSKHPDSDPPSNVQNMASLERWDHDPENSSDPTVPTFGSNDLDSDGEEMDPRDMDDSTNISVVKATESDQETIEDEDDVKVIKDTNDNESPMMPMSLPKHDMMSDRELITRRILQQQQQMQQNASVTSSPLPMIPVSPLRAASPSQTPSPHPSPGGRTIINPERDNYNVDKILDCWQCGLHFATRKMLLRHLKEHNIDYPYKCYLCDASYQSRRDCLEHKIEKHPDDWVGLKARNKIDDIPNFVEVMEKLTENDDKIEEMKKEGDDSVMAVERKVFCALCPKKFWSLQDLRRHMRSHTGEKPFECDICGRYFTLKHSMMRHRRKHQEGDIIIRQPRSSPFGNDMYKPEMGFNDSNEGRHSMGTPEQDPYVMQHYPPLRLPVMIPPPPRPQASVTPSSNSTPSSRPASRDGAASSLLAGLGGVGDSDLLGNLLGVDESALDEMLDSANSSSAAAMLGMAK